MRKRCKEAIELDLFQDEKTHCEDSQDCNLQMPHYDFSILFKRLSASQFRSHFHLKKEDLEYIETKGMDTIRRHAADFVAQRLAPAAIPNDGKQTPMRGHPVFIAQHATGCCCRSCFNKWHHIPPGKALTNEEQDYAVAVLMAWIEKEVEIARKR